jgi:triosephosphate isomerase
MAHTFARARRPGIAGNWKMHLGPSGTRDFFRDFTRAHPPAADRTILFFPPAVSLTAAVESLVERPDIFVGVQNIHWQSSGAFTGETSAPMAGDAGARFTLAGHSERRHVFGETDEQVGLKAAAALAAGLTPLICIGETLDERNAGRLEEVLARQLGAALDAIDPADVVACLIAYEPVWAIGTGVNATPDDAAGAHAFIRGVLGGRLDAAAAGAIPILYGGSVKPDNAADLLAATDVDGLLVGGASLTASSFAAIARA